MAGESALGPARRGGAGGLTLAQSVRPYTVGRAIKVDGGMLINKY